MTEEQELAERLTVEPPYKSQCTPEAPTQSTGRVASDVDFSQWQIGANGKFRPGARTCQALPSAIYRIGCDDFGPYLETLDISSDDIIELPEPAHVRVLQNIRRFWGSRDKYAGHGLLYKRGILLWGPPGGGKTVTVQLLMREIISRHSGIVLLAENPELCVAALRFVRRIERSRPLIVVFEDVDEIASRHGEHSLLAALDGEHQTDNVVYLATTNHPERLGARIVNRPSRFDERIKIGMPSADAREVYLRKTTSGSVDIAKWVADTEGLSVAHLRELSVAVLCLDQEYETVIDRLRAMEFAPKPEDGYKRREMGILAGNAALASKAGR